MNFEITCSKTIDGITHVEGAFEGRPFSMTYNPVEATGTIDGDFNDVERMQILTGWEIQQ